MKKIEAKIVADSINPQGDRITTYLLTFPRFILSELNTHRMFSKNSASSRAIPFEKMVKMVEEDPFIPIAWQFDHKGMQGIEYVTEESDFGGIFARNESWLSARDYAIQQAKDLNSMDTTKQLCNRLLEPFMWHTVLLTGTEFKNFFELRCPIYRAFGNVFKSRKDCIEKYPANINLTDLDWLEATESQAEIHMQALAEAMWDAYNESIPKELKEGEWHIPFRDKIDAQILEDFNGLTNSFTMIKISTARCARLSYMTFDGKVDYEKDIKLHDTLLESQHMSPFEHCARAMNDEEYYSRIKGKVPTYTDDYGIYNIEYYPICYKESVNFDGPLGENPNNGDKFGWCRNFKGFIQYRYLLENKTKL